MWESPPRRGLLHLVAFAKATKRKTRPPSHGGEGLARKFPTTCRFQPTPFVDMMKTPPEGPPPGGNVMAQYLLSVHHAPDADFGTEEEVQGIYDAVDAFNAKVREAGKWVFAGGLEGIEAATTV